MIQNRFPEAPCQMFALLYGYWSQICYQPTLRLDFLTSSVLSENFQGRNVLHRASTVVAIIIFHSTTYACYNVVQQPRLFSLARNVASAVVCCFVAQVIICVLARFHANTKHCHNLYSYFIASQFSFRCKLKVEKQKALK